MIQYSDENMKKTKAEIAQYQANFGGTEIFQPLEKVFSIKNSQFKDDKADFNVFLLTDG